MFHSATKINVETRVISLYIQELVLRLGIMIFPFLETTENFLFGMTRKISKSDKRLDAQISYGPAHATHLGRIVMMIVGVVHRTHEL